MKHAFVTLDVFTTTRFAGNPLAVVFDADSIGGAAMQKIAREFSHPETVFVLKPQVPGSTAQVRIFTPAVELPFAGHPTVGAALALALKHGGKDIILEEKIGLLKCRAAPSDTVSGLASFVLPALPESAGAAASNEAIAAALGIAPDDIGFDNHTPSKWRIGMTFTLIPLRSLDAVRRCRIVDANWDAAFEKSGRSFAYMFCREPEDKAHNFHARMFAPAAGVREDPATGSAAAAFSGFCAEALRLADGDHSFVIEQGFEMGRPSLIELGLAMRCGRLSYASIGGPAIVVTEGTIEA